MLFSDQSKRFPGSNPVKRFPHLTNILFSQIEILLLFSQETNINKAGKENAFRTIFSFCDTCTRRNVNEQ